VPPDDLLEGYRPAIRRRSLRRPASGSAEGRPRAAGRSGYARSAGWHSEADRKDVGSPLTLLWVEARANASFLKSVRG
jgi:hypothetical protein